MHIQTKFHGLGIDGVIHKRLIEMQPPSLFRGPTRLLFPQNNLHLSPDYSDIQNSFWPDFIFEVVLVLSPTEAKEILDKARKQDNILAQIHYT